MHIFEKKITLKKKPCVHSIDLRAPWTPNKGPLAYLFEPIAPAVTVDENMDEPEAARMGEVSEW